MGGGVLTTSRGRPRLSYFGGIMPSTLNVQGTLRPYQAAFFADAMQTLDAGEPGSWLYASPTGTGKSIMELTLLGFLTDFMLVTPRLEIVAGMLEKGGIDCKNWSAEKLAAEALEYRITTPIRFRNLLAKGELGWRPQGIIWDECFPAGTLVDGRQIETLRVGDTVTAFDDRTGRTPQRKITHVFKNPAPPRMLRILAGGRWVVTTPNHPFRTSWGWTHASDLTPGNLVLLDLRQPLQASTTCLGSVAEITPCPLLAELHIESSKCGKLRADGCNQPEVCVGTHGDAEPHETRRSAGEGVGHNESCGASPEDAGRQRTRDDGAGSCLGGGDRAAANERQHGYAVGGVPDSLQTRPCGTVREARHRGRRRQPQEFEGAGGGCEEGSLLAWARVDRVEVYELAGNDGCGHVRPDGFVYNLEVEGEHTYTANGFVVHNCHHRSADSYQDIRAYLGKVPEFGLTASPFRGTAKGTEEFLEQWDSLTWILTYPAAAEQGHIAVPNCAIWPLIDDDEIEVVNGELVVRGAEAAVLSRIDAIVERCRVFGRGWQNEVVANPHTDEVALHSTAAHWDRPTIFAVPTTETAWQLAVALTAAGLPAHAVTQDTPRRERADLFAACERSEIAIVQIDVVSEGVDLKLRRLIDLRPTMSPVKWLQQVGRVTRPPMKCEACAGTRIIRPFCTCEPKPEYVCCNRNLERHGYLYEGLFPAKTIAAAQQAFGSPTARAGARAVGVENLGRFTGSELPLADGTIGTMYQLTSVEGMSKREYAILLHPCSSQPLYATRENLRDSGTVQYGKWRLIEKLPDMRGFGSAPAKTVSDKQRAWWQRAAAAKGLDPKAEPNRRNFAALPVLTDLGIALKGGA